MPAFPDITRRKFLELLGKAVAAACAAAGLGGCESQESAPETPAPSPAISPPPSPPETTPTPSPEALTTLAEMPISLPENSVMEEIAGELTLAGEKLVSKRIIEASNPYVGGAPEVKVRFQELETEEGESVGWSIVGAISGTLVIAGENGTSRSYNLKGATVDEKTGRVDLNEEVLREIMHSGVAQYVDEQGRVTYEMPIYVHVPEEIDSETSVQPRISFTQSRDPGELPQLRIDWVGEDERVLARGPSTLGFQGERLSFAWEEGVYKPEVEEGFGLRVPEAEIMVEVITKEEVEAWWREHGIKKNGQLLEVDIEEDVYKDHVGNEVKTWKVVDGHNIVWARVFANVPREPRGESVYGISYGLTFKEKIEGRLAVRYEMPGSDPLAVSLIVNPTAGEEGQELKPILRKVEVKPNSSSPPIPVVVPYHWKEGLNEPEEMNITLYCLDESRLPLSIRGTIGREFNDTLASWVPGADRETLLHLVEIWRGMVCNDFPKSVETHGDIPYRLVVRGLGNFVTLVGNSREISQLRKEIIKEVISEVRSVSMRGEEGSIPVTSSTYDRGSETVLIAFASREGIGSKLWNASVGYQMWPNDATFVVASCLPTVTIRHEGGWGVRDDIGEERRENYQRDLELFNWLREVFAGSFTSEESRDFVAYLDEHYVPSLRERAGLD